MAVVLTGLAMLVVGAIDPEPPTRAPVTVSPELVAIAEEAGVDPLLLLGAVATTRQPARDYLISVGELLPPVPPGPPYGAAVARARCIISKESGGLDIPNRQGSGAVGPGQYFASTWARHTALYRSATGYSGPLSLHSLDHVTAVMSWILAALPSTRREWAVGGC